MENGFNIWSFNGKLLYRILKDHFFQVIFLTINLKKFQLLFDCFIFYVLVNKALRDCFGFTDMALQRADLRGLIPVFLKGLYCVLTNKVFNMILVK